MGQEISVLVIEDEAHIRTALEYNLKMDGFEVTLTEDGKSGLDTALSGKYNLILCDWMMPEMNGLEVVAELKNHEHTKSTPIFMLTAKSMEGDVEKALDEGADDYITKPFDPLKLGDILRDKLEKLAKSKV